MKVNIAKHLILVLFLVININSFAITVTIDDIKYSLNMSNRTAAVAGSSLVNVVVPETIIYDDVKYDVTSIGKIAFNQNYTTKSVKTGNSIKTVEESAFSVSGIREVYLGDNLESLANSAFCQSESLQKVYVGKKLKTIGKNAFSSCISLKYIVIPQTITSIPFYKVGDPRDWDAFYNTSCRIICLREGFSTGYPNQTTYPSSYITFINNTFDYNGKSPTIEYTFNGIGEGFKLTEANLSVLNPNAGTQTVSIPFTFTNDDMSFTVEIGCRYTINPATLTARVKDTTREYGETNPQFQSDYSGFVNGEDKSVITSCGSYSTSATTKSSVGTYSVTQSGATAQNYTFEYESGTLTVTKAPLTMTPRDKTMTYGDRIPNFDLDYKGLKNGETKPEWITEPTISTTASQKSYAGNYPITISSGVARNYNVTYKQGTLTINKAAVTLTTQDATREYGDDNPEFKLLYTGLKNGETAPVWSVAPTVASSAQKTSPVGVYNITASGGESRNYVITQYINNGKLTVNKAPLTAKARSYTKKQGEDNPILAVDYIGFKNGETKLALTQEPVATTTAQKNSSPGTYPITLSDGVAMNYELSYVSGTLTILPNDYSGNQTDNILTIENLKGNKNTQLTLPIALKNKHAITGLQIDLYLPDGVTVATNSKGKLMVSTTSRMEGSYTLTGNQMNGFVRIVGYSGDSDAFTGNDGDIMNVTLNIGNSITDGEYTIRLKDIVLSDVNNTEYHPADVGAKLTISSYTLGDVDNSGAININDVVCIINYILKRTNGVFFEEAADVDENGTVNINDVVTLINRYILHRNNVRAAVKTPTSQAVTDNNYLYLLPIGILPGQTIEVDMLLTNADVVKGVQGNIKLPNGLSFVTKSNGRLDVANNNARAEDFTLSCALQEDGSMTFAQYSGDGFAYEGNSGGLFTFKIKASENATPGSYQIQLSEMVLSIGGMGYDQPQSASVLNVLVPTDIESIDGNKPVDVYTLTGSKVRSNATTLEGLPRGVYVVNGKKMVVK